MVLGIVGVHLLLVLLMAVQFAQRTRYSTLGNEWQAVTRMVSPHTWLVMEGLDVVRDNRVKEWPSRQVDRPGYNTLWDIGISRWLPLQSAGVGMRG